MDGLTMGAPPEEWEEKGKGQAELEKKTEGKIVNEPELCSRRIVRLPAERIT